MTSRVASLAHWYGEHGRHGLAWRQSQDHWSILVSEVMLAQTQVSRVELVWPGFIAQFPTPAAMAKASPGSVIAAWGRLGYPRRARRLWEAACLIDANGWPTDYRTLPGVGPYTAGALAAQADDDPDAVGIDVNIRRVVQRVGGSLVRDKDAGAAAVDIARPLVGRDRLLALMDLGAQVCTPKSPSCDECPLRLRCVTRGPLVGEGTKPQARYEGSLRQRRGDVLRVLRETPTAAAGDFDASVLQSLLDDHLVRIDGRVVRLATD